MKAYPSASSPFLESEHWEKEYLEEERSLFSESGSLLPGGTKTDPPQPVQHSEDEEYIDEELWSKVYEPFSIADHEVDAGVLEERESRYGAEQTQFNVRWYQTILKVAGGYSDIAANGNHNDPNTRSALEDFQKRHGLEKKSGYLTVESNAALTRLAIHWIYNAPNGHPGTSTKQHIKMFQKDYGLEPDGRVGPITMSTMVDVLNGKLPRPFDFFQPSSTGKPRVRRELRQDLEASELFEDIIVGDEDREPQTNTPAAPNRWVCQCTMRDRVEYRLEKTNGKFTQSGPTSRVAVTGGTGCLIGPRHVLTAAHLLARISTEPTDPASAPTGTNVFKRIETGTFVFKPAFNGAFPSFKIESSPYCAAEDKRELKSCNAFESASLDHPTAYELFKDGIVVDFDQRHDYALVKLSKNVDKLAPTWTRTFRLRGKKRVVNVQAPELGYWGASDNYRIQATTPTALDGREVFTIGYPSPTPRVKVRPRRRQMQWKSRGIVDGNFHARSSWLSQGDPNQAHLFCHTADTSNSNSGSPIWIEDGDTKILVGIHVSGVPGTSKLSGPFNIGLALTESVLEQIRDWDPQTFRFRNGQLIVK